MQPARGEPHPLVGGASQASLCLKPTNATWVELAPALRKEGYARKGVGEVEASITNRLGRTDDAVHDGVLGTFHPGPSYLLPRITCWQSLGVDVDPCDPGRHNNQRVALDDEVADGASEGSLRILDVLHLAADQTVLVLCQELRPGIQYRHCPAPITVAY